MDESMEMHYYRRTESCDQLAPNPNTMINFDAYTIKDIRSKSRVWGHHPSLMRT